MPPQRSRVKCTSVPTASGSRLQGSAHPQGNLPTRRQAPPFRPEHQTPGGAETLLRKHAQGPCSVRDDDDGHSSPHEARFHGALRLRSSPLCGGARGVTPVLHQGHPGDPFVPNTHVWTSVPEARTERMWDQRWGSLSAAESSSPGCATPGALARPRLALARPPLRACRQGAASTTAPGSCTRAVIRARGEQRAPAQTRRRQPPGGSPNPRSHRQEHGKRRPLATSSREPFPSMASGRRAPQGPGLVPPRPATETEAQ